MKYDIIDAKFCELTAELLYFYLNNEVKAERI